MKILLDKSPRHIKTYTEKYGHNFGQLLTPLTGNKRAVGVTCGIDNGCFSTFKSDKWKDMMQHARNDPEGLVFVALPDVVGDARRTLELFDHFAHFTIGLPKALVLQDGIGNFPIPWNDIKAVFVGGSDRFKISQEAIAACKAAKILSKWVHVGRVNTVERVKNWIDLADSIDGTGLIFDPDKIPKILAFLDNKDRQQELIK